ncbi:MULTISPECIES: aminoglycoside phosphotransferase family protein [Kribbella]|uniref:aminoglycoside phosphotransferase family protein n=1 Tax=Kribbella TaxID=182639 RepID=UPI0013050F33|nr:MULTISPECIES: aminoglycoside phosphotransferase family protein [Kribbella]
MYGLHFEELQFIPLGWVSAGYSVNAGDEQYFLKLWPGGRDAAGAVARLPFVRELHEAGFRARLPYPVPTRAGELSGSVPAGVVALFPFLPGATPADWPKWPDAVLDELGRVLAALHSATPSVVLPREHFSLAVADELRLHLGERIVRPERAALMDQLELLERLQSAVRGLPQRFVVCHADLAGDNLLVDEHGRLSALDWDSAMLAPAECDLALLLHGEQPVDGNVLRRVLAVYPVDKPLELDLFAFFLLRRYVSDYTARVVRLLHGSPDAADAEEAREGMRTWGSAQWERLDATLSIARGALLDR